MTEPGTTIGRTARVLGVAGLLPQAGALALVGTGRPNGAALAILYAALVLSFLGGIWWGFAMRRGAGQARLAGLAAVPSLAAVAILVATLALGSPRGGLVALALALLATLPVDQRLELGGAAPEGWFRLRIALSTGLALLSLCVAALLRG